MEPTLDWIVSSGGWTLRNSLESSVLILLVAGIAFFWRNRISSGFARRFG